MRIGQVENLSFFESAILNFELVKNMHNFSYLGCPLTKRTILALCKHLRYYTAANKASKNVGISHETFSKADSFLLFAEVF